MIDYLIVGSGLAGICFAEIASQNNKSFLVVDDFKRSSSRVAGGLYNPVILKRFSQVWKATEQLEYGKLFYADIENKLGLKFDFPLPVYRKFASIEEQNNWFQASDKPNLSSFLAPKVISKKYSGITSIFGFGEVLQTGYLDTVVFLDSYILYLKEKELLLQTTFCHDELAFTDSEVLYKGVSYRNVIFSEGFGMVRNPFFNELPLDGTKGELLVIKAPELDLDVVLKSSVFILPIGNHLYKVGSTYNWDDKTDIPTEDGKNELIQNLKELLDCDFEVVEHYAGVRPTVNDRRPLVGSHPEHSNLHLLNGLGTRGVMLGPWLAKALFENIEYGIELDHQIDIKRFYKKRGAK